MQRALQGAEERHRVERWERHLKSSVQWSKRWRTCTTFAVPTVSRRQIGWCRSFSILCLPLLYVLATAMELAHSPLSFPRPLAVAQITATQHDGKDDEVGVRMGPHTLPHTFPVATYETGADYRRYRVSHGQLLKVKVKNLSAKPLSFQPVYVSAEGNEEPEEFIEPLKQGEVSTHVLRARALRFEVRILETAKQRFGM